MCRYCVALNKKNRWDNPKEGQLRVWWVPQVPIRRGDNAFHIPAKTPEDAAQLLSTLAKYDLYQLYHKIKPDFSNAGGLEVWDGKDWVNWEDDDGNDINLVMGVGEVDEEAPKAVGTNYRYKQLLEKIRENGIQRLIDSEYDPNSCRLCGQ